MPFICWRIINNIPLQYNNKPIRYKPYETLQFKQDNESRPSD